MRSRVNELFTRGRSAPGSRSIKVMMQEEGEQIGRFEVRSLMRELALVSKQPGVKGLFKKLKKALFCHEHIPKCQPVRLFARSG